MLIILKTQLSPLNYNSPISFSSLVATCLLFTRSTTYYDAKYLYSLSADHSGC